MTIDEAAREQYLCEKYAERSKRPHDYWWRMADAISGSADYVYGQDEGEPPAGAR